MTPDARPHHSMAASSASVNEPNQMVRPATTHSTPPSGPASAEGACCSTTIWKNANAREHRPQEACQLREHVDPMIGFAAGRAKE